jgi:hypothetical protein
MIYLRILKISATFGQSNETSGSEKNKEFLDWLRYFRLLKKNTSL